MITAYEVSKNPGAVQEPVIEAGPCPVRRPGTCGHPEVMSQLKG